MRRILQVVLGAPGGNVAFCDVDLEGVGPEWRDVAREAFEEVLAKMSDEQVLEGRDGRLG